MRMMKAMVVEAEEASINPVCKAGVIGYDPADFCGSR